MDLTAIPGIGPTYKERLQQAGIADVDALARVPDLSSLSEWTGIAPARLASFQAHALKLMDRTPADEGAETAEPENGGIVLDAPEKLARTPPMLLLRKAGIRVVAAVGALGATLRPGAKKAA